MTLLLSAGEASGDTYGAQLIEALRQLAPETKFFGMGGEQMDRNRLFENGAKNSARIIPCCVLSEQVAADRTERTRRPAKIDFIETQCIAARCSKRKRKKEV